MNPQLKAIVDALENLFPKSGTKEGVDATLEMEQRAQAAGLETKALDAEAGTKALAAVKELEAKLEEATALITKQANDNAAILASVKAIETAQAAYQARGEKAIGEVKTLLVTLNTKPDLAAPPQQALLTSIEQKTKEKIEAATNPSENLGGTGLRRTVWGADGKSQAVAIQ